MPGFGSYGPLRRRMGVMNAQGASTASGQRSLLRPGPYQMGQAAGAITNMVQRLGGGQQQMRPMTLPNRSVAPIDEIGARPYLLPMRQGQFSGAQPTNPTLPFQQQHMGRGSAQVPLLGQRGVVNSPLGPAYGSPPGWNEGLPQAQVTPAVFGYNQFTLPGMLAGQVAGATAGTYPGAGMGMGSRPTQFQQAPQQQGPPAPPDLPYSATTGAGRRFDESPEGQSLRQMQSTRRMRNEAAMPRASGALYGSGYTAGEHPGGTFVPDEQYREGLARQREFNRLDSGAALDPGRYASIMAPDLDPIPTQGAAQAGVNQRIEEFNRQRAKFGSVRGAINAMGGPPASRPGGVIPNTRDKAVADFARGLGPDPGNLSPLEQRRVESIQGQQSRQQQRREFRADTLQRAAENRAAQSRYGRGGQRTEGNGGGQAAAPPPLRPVADAQGNVDQQATLRNAVDELSRMPPEQAQEWIRQNNLTLPQLRDYAMSELYPGVAEGWDMELGPMVSGSSRAEAERRFREYEALRQIDPTLPPWPSNVRRFGEDREDQEPQQPEAAPSRRPYRHGMSGLLFN